MLWNEYLLNNRAFSIIDLITYSDTNKINSFYKGQTSNLTDRLYRHNHRYEKATQAGVPWKLIWTSGKPSRSDALILEKKLKNLSIKRTIEFILKYNQGIPSSDELLFLQKLSECWPLRQHSTLGLPDESATIGVNATLKTLTVLSRFFLWN